MVLSQAASLNSSVRIYHGSCEYKAQYSANIIGAYMPQCDADGNFLPQQCWASSGYCWCVNVLTGVEIPGTRTPPGTMPVNCEPHAYQEIGQNIEKENYCPSGWSRYGTRCFIFIETTKTWVEAETYCIFEGATLASIHSEEENHFIQALTRGDTHNFPSTWIGGQDAVQNGLWMWADGSRFDYVNWYPGLSHSTIELHWDDKPCGHYSPFVCAKKI
uniref:ladderlectin-like n=1 Tax=Centroberyx gerrardi TaxID=166262 RepID=UPI003AAE0A8C